MADVVVLSAIIRRATASTVLSLEFMLCNASDKYLSTHVATTPLPTLRGLAACTVVDDIISFVLGLADTGGFFVVGFLFLGWSGLLDRSLFLPCLETTPR